MYLQTLMEIGKCITFIQFMQTNTIDLSFSLAVVNMQDAKYVNQMSYAFHLSMCLRSLHLSIHRHKSQFQFVSIHLPLKCYVM